MEGADGIVTALQTKCIPTRLIEFLRSQRPGTTDLSARNREIEVIAYLNGDWDVAMEAVQLQPPHSGSQSQLESHSLLVSQLQ